MFCNYMCNGLTARLEAHACEYSSNVAIVHPGIDFKQILIDIPMLTYTLIQSNVVITYHLTTR